MSFSQFETFNAYQPQVAQMLINSFQKNRLAHAYIFEGPRGTKKLDAAFLFAKRMLCLHPEPNQNPCGVCRNCRRIEAGNHPNVFRIAAEGEFIKVDQIRAMIAELSRTSVEEGARVYIVEEADRMRAEAANALLKTLEEPGNDIYAIMLTDKYNSLLKTIVSRSQVMHFKPIDKALIKADLLEKGIEPCIASVIPEYTNNHEEAIRIAESPEMASLFMAVPELYGMAGKSSASMILRFREIRDSVFVNWETTDYFLMLLILYQKDLLHCKLARTADIVWVPEMEKMTKLAASVSQRWIEDVLEKMLALKSRLKFNIIDSLAFDNLFIQLERGFNHAI
jgi:DNA polymerase-3 subunit delta'